LGNQGVDIVDAYLGQAGILTGSARATQEALEKAAEIEEQNEIKRLEFEIERKKDVLNAQLLALEAEFKSEEEKLRQMIEQKKRKEKVDGENRQKMTRIRKSDGE
jgi:circadian clock protein KaiC